jgi:hypothetical protein
MKTKIVTVLPADGWVATQPAASDGSVNRARVVAWALTEDGRFDAVVAGQSGGLELASDAMAEVSFTFEASNRAK